MDWQFGYQNGKGDEHIKFEHGAGAAYDRILNFRLFDFWDFVVHVLEKLAISNIETG